VPLRSVKTRSWVSQDVDAQFNTLIKTNAERKVWQSHGHRDGNHKEHSCRDPFGSMIEPLPKLVVGEVPCCRNSIMTTTIRLKGKPY
jgi:hypothetical protein